MESFVFFRCLSLTCSWWWSKCRFLSDSILTTNTRLGSVWIETRGSRDICLRSSQFVVYLFRLFVLLVHRIRAHHWYEQSRSQGVPSVFRSGTFDPKQQRQQTRQENSRSYLLFFRWTTTTSGRDCLTRGVPSCLDVFIPSLSLLKQQNQVTHEEQSKETSKTEIIQEWVDISCLDVVFMNTRETERAGMNTHSLTDKHCLLTKTFLPSFQPFSCLMEWCRSWFSSQSISPTDVLITSFL